MHFVVLFGSENGVFQFPLKSVILILAKWAKIVGPGGPLKSAWKTRTYTYFASFSDGVLLSSSKVTKFRWTTLILWREILLRKLLDQYRKTDGNYDCIVSSSGGKDSSSIAHILKYKYQMNPLTVTYSPILYTDIGFKNLRAMINIGGFDNLLFTPNGKLTSILAREAFVNLLHPMQPCVVLTPGTILAKCPVSLYAHSPV